MSGASSEQRRGKIHPSLVVGRTNARQPLGAGVETAEWTIESTLVDTASHPEGFLVFSRLRTTKNLSHYVVPCLNTFEIPNSDEYAANHKY